MTEIFPNYYKKFKCIADKCRHSCCVGWEIDIDKDTMRKYSELSHPYGKKIRESIENDTFDEFKEKYVDLLDTRI